MRRTSADASPADLAPQVTVTADDVHIIVGTIATIDAAATRMTITWTEDGKEDSEEVALSPSTSITRNGVGVAKSELKAGVKVTVLAAENHYLVLDVLEATDILLGRESVRTIFE